VPLTKEKVLVPAPPDDEIVSEYEDPWVPDSPEVGVVIARSEDHLAKRVTSEVGA
jgi:hypothetical protein